MYNLFRTHLSLAISSIRTHRARSFLTCLGIAVGIASIVLILSLTGSVTRLITSELGDYTSELLIVRPTATKDTVTSIVESLTLPGLYQTSSLTLSDYNLLSALDQITAAAPVAVTTSTITDEQNIVSGATILGTSPDFDDLADLSLSHGTFLTQDNRANSVVLGHMLSLLLFNTSNPVGRTLTFRDQRFIVVGVLSDTTDTINFHNLDYNNTLIMDITNFSSLIAAPQIQQIDLRAADADTMDDTAAAITATLEASHSGDTNFSVTYGDTLTHPASSLLSTISHILILIAGISLLVGGIGVMNIMLASVAERTHEIGIRKSVGASSQHIMMQFVLESIILSLLGGLLGIVLGYLLAFLISIVTPFAPYLTMRILFITLLTSVIIGTLFGTYPALRAARQDPIDALRSNR